jgi:hypothetical protein
MNDVKFLCETLLDEPAPPLRDVADVLVVAHRAKARRTAALSAAGAFAGVAAIGAALLAVPRGPAPQPIAGGAGTATPPASAAPTKIPPVRIVPSHGRQVFDFLSKALPSSYTARTQYPFSTNSTPYPSTPGQPLPSGAQGVYGLTVSIIVSDGSGEGQIWSLTVDDQRPAPTGDLCAPAVAARVKDLPGTPCRQTVVSGIPIRITTQKDDGGRDEVTAQRFLDGGYLDLIARQSVLTSGSWVGTLPPDAVSTKLPSQTGSRPALTTPFFTPEQVAALVANPVMLP